MREIGPCILCGDRPPLLSEPCADCGAFYCARHLDREVHVCTPFHTLWRTFVANLGARGLVEYRSLRPVRIKLGEIAMLDYLPSGRLLTAAGVDALHAFTGSVCNVSVHSQQAVDVLARVLRLEPIRATFVDMVIHGLDGSVRGGAIGWLDSGMPRPPTDLN